MPKEEKDDQDKDTSGKKEPEKLIAGKYKTVEDAEAGIKESERKMHDALAEAARYKESLESVLAEPSPKPNDKSNRSADDEPVLFADEPEETFAQRFMENPKKYLAAIKAQAKQEAVAESAAHNELYLATREYMGKYLDDNADLKTNGRLFALHLANTNPRERLGKRLDDAAKMTRDEIARIREDVRKAKDFQKGQKDKADSVEGDGDADDASNRAPRGADKGTDSFDEYMKDRQAQHAKSTGGVI